MPVNQGHDRDDYRSPAIAFAIERDLEEVIANNPKLITQIGDPPVKLLARQVALPRGGIADILFIDKDGVPTVVEVKLSGNPDLDNVVHQALRYASALHHLSYQELDAVLGGGLDKSLRSGPNDDKDEAYEHRRNACAQNLKAGHIRIILVVDVASNKLAQVPHYLRDRGLDIRVLSIKQHRDPSTSQMRYEPQFHLYEPQDLDDMPFGPRRSGSQTFEIVLREYAKIAPAGFQEIAHLKPTWAQIRPRAWPIDGSKLHYEFQVRIKHGDKIGVEIHDERKSKYGRQDKIEEILHEFVGDLSKDFPGKVEWDSRLQYGGYGLVILYDAAANPIEIAQAMCTLILRTNKKIEDELKRLGPP